jgi:hypothetical protein
MPDDGDRDSLFQPKRAEVKQAFGAQNRGVRFVFNKIHLIDSIVRKAEECCQLEHQVIVVAAPSL